VAPAKDSAMLAPSADRMVSSLKINARGTHP
jgi:hypothetical protein